MWTDLLTERADELAATAMASIRRDFPYHLRHLMEGPGDHPAHPREVHPSFHGSFHGSFDWHSSVEMHWVLVRLHESSVDVPRAEIRALLDERLAVEPLAREAEYCAENPGHSRPYGLAWALWLAHDAQGSPWATALEPLAETAAATFRTWLPKLTYPVRHGMHGNTAFALSRILPYAEARDPDLHALVIETATRMFADDTDYPARYEPSGFDFLSPALAEAELMASVLPDFPTWFARFLPDPHFTPAHVSDTSDGLIAHLHGLNLSRAWSLRRIAAAVQDGSHLEAAAIAHAKASLDHVSGDDFMVEHWLACYALLLLDVR